MLEFLRILREILGICLVFYLAWLAYNIFRSSSFLYEEKEEKNVTGSANSFKDIGKGNQIPIDRPFQKNRAVVDTLPPEAIAPSILSPPKMQGGFGKVEKSG